MEPFDDRGLYRIRPKDPKKYGGVDDPEALEDWLTELLMYCQISGLTGSSNDWSRINILSTSLEGAARLWFLGEVIGPA